jgi:hypothetical protein
MGPITDAAALQTAATRADPAAVVRPSRPSPVFRCQVPPTSLASRGRIQPSLETASEASDSASLSQTLGTLTLSRRFRLQAARWSATLRAFQAAMRTPARPATLAAEAHGALRSALGLAGSACACVRDYRNLTIVSRICAAFLQWRGGLWRAKLCWWPPRKYQLREGAQLFSVLSSEG